MRRWHNDGPAKPVMFCVGVDLGQSRDFSTIVVNELNLATRTYYQEHPREPNSLPSVLREETVAHHRLRHIERIPLGTSYPDVLERVAAVMRLVPVLPRPPMAIFDQTGVGRPVVDLARRMELQPYGVTITAGSQEKLERNEAHVAKKILASVIAVALDTERLTVVANGPHVEVLKEELRNFRVKITADTGNEKLEAWRDSQHDDLVLGAALAVWAGERVGKRFQVNPQFSLMAT